MRNKQWYSGGPQLMQNIEHDQSISETSTPLEPECRGSETKQSDKGVQPNESDIYMSDQHKNSQTPLPDTNVTVRRKGPVATSTKQMAGYFTVSGIENELSIPENNWPCFALKELLDNAYDWLNDYYPNSSSSGYNNKTRRRHIAICIQIDKISNDADLTRVFRVAVRNSNVDRIEVFGGEREGLEQIFDYTQWLSTKRYQHRMTAGSLGDYLKRHGGMGYGSWNNIVRSSNSEVNYDNDDNIQWEEPIIFRFNGTEYKVFVYYDRYRGLPEPVIKYAGKSDAIDYTEVECALPVSRINCNGIDGDEVPLFDKLYRYYTWYKIPKTDIKFSLDMRYDIRHVTEEDD
jgi:hypothetical protein